jgi:hypothetical protein
MDREYIFYRVEDDGTVVKYDKRRGFSAPRQVGQVITNPTTYKDERTLTTEIRRHLDWGNRKKTYFVSVYKQKWAAERCVRNRIALGRQNVRLYTINLRETDEDITYRQVRKLARMVDYRIPKRAWNNTEEEFFVWNGLPAETCVRIEMCN